MLNLAYTQAQLFQMGLTLLKLMAGRSSFNLGDACFA